MTIKLRFVKFFKIFPRQTFAPYGIYQLITVKLILDVEQFGVSSDLIDPTQCAKVSFFSSTCRSMDSTEAEISTSKTDQLLLHVMLY